MEKNNYHKLVAEFLGTMVLVLMGCGSAVISSTSGVIAGVGLLGISFAFGLSVVAMAYAIGHISGCHINPAISIGMVAAGRMRASECIGYVIVQILGAIAGAGILYLIASGRPDWNIATSVAGLGQNGYGPGSPRHYDLTSCFIAEFVFTAIFLLVIFGSTSSKNIHGGFAGLAIGLSLVLIHIVGIPITGVSVNPARSIGPAVFVGGQALEQVWLFVVAPIAGAIVAAIIWRYFVERTDNLSA
ncbi:aquaporin Z [Mucilaginibacter jinjuensis]|uniref:Aquaporin Z n=1 Tax=Mucilaginibacter jinjuensis TaxID=1176721 RepID=A0ABY7T5A1_9SPHI|nr:aquaporin Z [Mucilaginibacter jinjuensis]WCT11625.1 aquaporin Z [Mucilaginibacter jinjuensis]